MDGATAASVMTFVSIKLFTKFFKFDDAGAVFLAPLGSLVGSLIVR